MKAPWRILSRWYLDHGIRAKDLCLSSLVCCLAWGGLLWGEPGVWLSGYPFTVPVVLNVLLGLVLLVLALLVFSWRRWTEIDSLLAEADTDALTGIYNRRKIERLLALEFDRALRYNRPLSVVMIDVDHFKQINDQHGHAVGDVVLSTIVRRILRRKRTCDHFGRWGGEEFLLVCPETDTPGAMKIADRMRRTIKQAPMRKIGIVTASFGVSSYHGQGDYESLVDQADCYLYMAKDQGRDKVMSRLIVMDQIQAGDGVSVGCMPCSQQEDLSSPLSTLLSTIATPLRRLRKH